MCTRTQNVHFLFVETCSVYGRGCRSALRYLALEHATPGLIRLPTGFALIHVFTCPMHLLHTN